MDGRSCREMELGREDMGRDEGGKRGTFQCKCLGEFPGMPGIFIAGE